MQKVKSFQQFINRIDETKLSQFKISTNPWWDNKFGQEINTRDIFTATQNIGMVILGLSKKSKTYAKTLNVAVNKIVPSQPTVTINKTKEYIENPPAALPVLGYYKSNFYVIEGHHTLAAQIVKDVAQIKATVYFYNENGKQIKPTKKVMQNITDI